MFENKLGDWIERRPLWQVVVFCVTLWIIAQLTVGDPSCPQ